MVILTVSLTKTWAIFVFSLSLIFIVYAITAGFQNMIEAFNLLNVYFRQIYNQEKFGRFINSVN